MDDEKKPSLADRINTARAQAERLDLPNPDHEVDNYLAEQGDRLAQNRVTYRHEIAGRVPAQSAEPVHKADLVTPFQSFEVQHVIEVRRPDGKSTELWERAGFEDTYGDTGMITGLSMSIEKIRQRPDFVAEKWAVIGHGQETGPTMIGAYEDQKTARDVLGGITGDRNYDQRPQSQTTEVALWHGFAQAIESLPDERPKLAERMTAGIFEQEIRQEPGGGYRRLQGGGIEEVAHLREARLEAAQVVEDRIFGPGVMDRIATSQKHLTRKQEAKFETYLDQTKNRPNEKLLGRDHELQRQLENRSNEKLLGRDHESQGQLNDRGIDRW